MKAILEFTLPEEDTELREALNVGKFHSALSDIYNVARGELKHGANTQESLTTALEEIKSMAAKAIFNDD